MTAALVHVGWMVTVLLSVALIVGTIRQKEQARRSSSELRSWLGATKLLEELHETLRNCRKLTDENSAAVSRVINVLSFAIMQKLCRSCGTDFLNEAINAFSDELGDIAGLKDLVDDAGEKPDA